MVPIAARPLTKLSFRRDVKLFLAALFGYLIVVILTLLILLQSAHIRTTELTVERWDGIAESVTDVAQHGGPVDDGSLRERLQSLQLRFRVSRLELNRGEFRVLALGAQPLQSFTIIKTSQIGQLTFHFDASSIELEKRRFNQIAAICLASTLFGTILLLLYLPRLVRPIEQMLDHAKELGEKAADVDEAHYLVETFRNSIRTMREQELELKRLHDLQKARADDLERIAATLKRSLTSGFLALDPSNRLLEVNSAAREFLDLAEEVGGKSLSETLGDTPFTRQLSEAASGRLSLTRAEVLSSDAPDAKTIGLTTVPLSNDDGEYLGLLALFTDLTEIRALENRLRELQTLADLGQISAGIAHEFRNSLSTILGYLKLAKKSGNPEELDQRLQSAEDEATLLSQAVSGLLSFARPMNLEFHPFDLDELIAELAERLEVEDIPITVTGSAGTITADRPLLARAIENLIRNAIDAVREAHRAEGRITIRLDRSPARIEVRDNGIGVDPAQAARLFLPFQSMKSHGFGLGLSLSRKIVVLHNGEITLDGEPGSGAVATITLPENAGPIPTDTFRNNSDQELRLHELSKRS